MPKIHEKLDALRGVVFSYADKPTVFYYREPIGNKKYRYKRIPNATTLAEAIANAFVVYEQMRNEPIVERSTTSIKQDARVTFHSAITKYLETIDNKVTANQLSPSTYERYYYALTKHVEPYLKDKGIEFTDQMRVDTLDDYVVFRKGASKLTVQKELSITKAFIDHYLIRHQLIEPSVAMSRDLIPKVIVKQVDLDANPSIRPEDWIAINKYIRYDYIRQAKEHNSPRVLHWRMLMWTFIMLLRYTGARPNELRSLRWKDVEIVNVGRYSHSQNKQVDRLIAYITLRDSKTGTIREVPCNGADALLRWMKYRVTYCKSLGQMEGVNSPQHYVFCNPHDDNKPYAHVSYFNAWKVILSGVQDKLRGNKFSSRGYTLYSFRSSYVEQMLMKGIDVHVVARLAGHSVSTLMRHYNRLDVRMKTADITEIKYNKPKDSLKIAEIISQ
jgi:integrase